MPAGRELIEPPGYALVSFLAAAMVVAGIGLAWTGLLLAAAGVVLSVIESKELLRLNPWLVNTEVPEESAFAARGPRRIGQLSLLVVVIGSIVAAAAFQRTDEAISVVPAALAAGLVSLLLNAQLRRVLRDPKAPKPPKTPKA